MFSHVWGSPWCHTSFLWLIICLLVCVARKPAIYSRIFANIHLNIHEYSKHAVCVLHCAQNIRCHCLQIDAMDAKGQLARGDAIFCSLTVTYRTIQGTQLRNEYSRNIRSDDETKEKWMHKLRLSTRLVLGLNNKPSVMCGECREEWGAICRHNVGIVAECVRLFIFLVRRPSRAPHLRNSSPSSP